MSNWMCERPKNTDTEEDLLRFQEEFLRQKRLSEEKEKKLHHPSDDAEFLEHKNLRESIEGPWDLGFEQEPTKEQKVHEEFAAKKFLAHKNLTESTDSPFYHEQLKLNPPAKILGDICERNVDVPYKFPEKSKGSWRFSMDTGFPDVSDLDPKGERMPQPTTSDDLLVDIERIKLEVHRENERIVSGMRREQVLEEQREIAKKLDPNLLEFLRKRGAKRSKEGLSSEKQDISFQKHQQRTPVSDYSKSLAEEAIKNLEVLSTTEIEDTDSLRLAADPLTLDLATKCSILTNQQREKKTKMVMRLFDTVAVGLRDPVHRRYCLEEIRKASLPPTLDTLLSQEELLEIAADNIHHIKKCYVDVGSDQFLIDIDPLLNPLWFLEPIHQAYLDKMRDNRSDAGISQITPLNRVAYTLMFSYLLFNVRLAYFRALVRPTEVFCRLAQALTLGPEIFNDLIIYNYLAAFLKEYLIPEAAKNRLHFSSPETPLAGLDAFAAFYDQLMDCFDEYSYSDYLFSHYVLLPAYGIPVITEDETTHEDPVLVLKLCLWSTEETGRQATLKHLKIPVDKCLVPGPFFAPRSHENVQLALLYAENIARKRVTPNDTPLMYKIAYASVKHFWHNLPASEKNSRVGQTLRKLIMEQA